MLHILFYPPDWPAIFPSCPAWKHWWVQLQKWLSNDAISCHNPPIDPLWHKHFSLKFHVVLGIEPILASCWHWLVLCTFHNYFGFPKIPRDWKIKNYFKNCIEKGNQTSLLCIELEVSWSHTLCLKITKNVSLEFYGEIFQFWYPKQKLIDHVKWDFLSIIPTECDRCALTCIQ